MSPTHDRTSARAPIGLLLGLLALVLRIPGFAAERHLTFDDGVFGASAMAMRGGGVPFRQVFSSQGPLFLPLVWLGDLLGFRVLSAPRILAVVCGVVITVVAHRAATRLADPIGALVTGVLVATSGCLMWVTGPLAADAPALAFATIAFALSLSQIERPTTSRAAFIGLAVGGAMSTKAIEAHVLVPVALALLDPVIASIRRHERPVTGLARALLAGGVAIGTYLVVSLPFGLGLVWQQSVTYRTAATTGPTPVANLGKALSTLGDRDLLMVITAIVAILLWGVARSRGKRPVPPGDPITPMGEIFSGQFLLTAWLVTTCAWLVIVVTPMWRAHVSMLVVPFALFIGRWRPTRRSALIAVACAALVAVPLQLHGLLRPPRYAGDEATIQRVLRGLPKGAWALSDDPGLVWRAGRRTTDDLVDTSMVGQQQGRYTERSVALAAADPQVCAVAVRSHLRFGAFPGLGAALERVGYHTVGPTSRDHALYVREDCRPPRTS